MARRTFGRKQILQNYNFGKEEKQVKFEWIEQLEGQFRKTVQKPIELRQTIMKNSQLQRCLQHNIIFSIYCTICRKILCASCMYSNLIHRKHRVIPIENAPEEMREDIKTFDSKIPRIIQLSDGIINANSDYLVKMERFYNPILLRIQQFYQNMRQLIKTKEKEQLNYLKEKRQMIRNQIAAYNKELSRINQYVTEKYKSYANTNIKPELLIPSRNILENLLAATDYVKESTLDLQKFRFTVEVDKIKQTQEDIVYKISTLVPIFQENLLNAKLRIKTKNKKQNKSLSMDKMTSGKKNQKNSLQKKRLNSSIAAGARTQRKF